MKNILTLICMLSTVLGSYAQSDVLALEYFIDTDLGVGNNTAITITQGPTVDITFSIDIPSLNLAAGYHYLFVRAQAVDLTWSMVEKRSFVISAGTGNTPDPIQDVTALEYFIDVDPGQGNGTAISVTTGSTVDLSYAITDNITEGWHTVGVRSQNANSVWGFVDTRRFYVAPVANNSDTSSKIVAVEYFFGADPGQGNGTAIDIGAATDLVDLASVSIPTTVDMPLDTAAVITVRAKNENGEWSFAERRTFEVADDCTQPIAGFTANLACASEVVTLVDNSTSVAADATYKWYLDGDDIADATIVGDTAVIFDNPGTYTVALAIRQGRICLDSISMDIVIKKKPIVVFSADPVELGTASQFLVDQFDVDGSATWAWDFESDGTVDDTTAGNNTYTYTSTGTYSASLKVMDGAGCDAAYTRDVKVIKPTEGTTPNTEIMVFAGASDTDPEILNDNSTVIDMGNSRVGTDLTQSITLKNTGAVDLIIYSVTPSSNEFTVGTVPTTIESGNTQSFEVTLSSINAGVFSTTLIIKSNDEDESLFLVDLTGEIIGLVSPMLSLEVSPITYGDAAFELVATTLNTTSEVSYTSSDESILSIVGTTATVMGVGDFTISVSQAADDTYFEESFSIDLNIAKAQLTVTADDVTKMEREEVPALTMSYEGFAYEDSEGDITPPDIVSIATVDSKIGEYLIVLTGGSADNYELTLVNGTISVIKSTVLTIADDLLDIKLFPNPAQSDFMIESKDLIVSVSVYNTQGKLLRHFAEAKSQYPIEELETGIYIVLVETGKEVLSLRMVKN